MKPIRVIELFAGVGGFRLGLEGWEGNSASSGYREKLENANPYEVVWSNQWEPNKKLQHASNVYRNRWLEKGIHKDGDFHEIVENYRHGDIPPHNLMVGGFPCQDYSVANTLKRAQGIQGKKGVLWWDIYNLLVKLEEKRLAPEYLMFENVDRLINSPRQDRGRDFAIILACLRDLGYAVEWRIINAADYGMPQRRRRTFILGYRKGTEIYSQMKKARERAVTECGVICLAFSARYSETKTFVLDKDIQELSNGFSFEHGGKTPFLGAGFMLEGRIWTARVEEALNNIIQPPVVLKDCLEAQCATSSFRVDDDLVHDSERGWAFHKGPKKRKRKDASTGYEYLWAEGGMPLTDDLDRPARTILTSEGGASPGRSKHLIKTDGIYRRLTPVELEKISMFPSNHTEIGKDPQRGDYRISDSQRAFFMGNALVVGVVERLGYTLAQKIKQGDEKKMKKSSEVKAKAR